LVKYSSSRRRPVVTADGDGIANHVGTLLLAEVADRTGLTDGFSRALRPGRQRRSAHDPGVVARDVAVMLADGGDCVSDLAALRGQQALFGKVASNATAWRVLGQLAPERLAGLRAARAQAREHVWEVGGAPKGTLILDFDSTLVDAHSEKERAAGTYKGGFGFHPLVCYLDGGSDRGPEPLAGMLRPGSASPDDAADHLALLEEAVAQIPASWRGRERPKLARSDSAAASHDFVDALRDRGIEFSIGFPIRSWVRQAILDMPKSAWIPALTQDGDEREGAEVCELHTLDLSGWPTGTRAICRRERAHPGAQLRLWEDEGLRHQVFITDQQDADIAVLEARHRCRAHVEDGIRCAKDTGLTNLPSAAFAFNQVWLDLVLTAQCLTAWMQALCLRGQARRWEPKRLRHRLFHTAARVVRTGRRVILRLQQSWPWATDLARAFTRLRTVPQAP
jgi:Transposase DDE domain group 1